jgi:hypothetical protein
MNKFIKLPDQTLTWQTSGEVNNGVLNMNLHDRRWQCESGFFVKYFPEKKMEIVTFFYE